MTDTTTLRVATADATVVRVTAESVATTTTVDTSTTVITTGAIGPRGPQGDEGDIGPTGLSAYEVALLEGFIGTEQDWLASLVGAAGTSGGSYTHSQGATSTTWTINHNLGYVPNVEAFDSGGTRIIGDITIGSVNQLTLTFSVALSGVAYLS